jgi:hypothetical protein
VLVRIPLDGGVLVLREVLLVLSGHADVFRIGPDDAGRDTCLLRSAFIATAQGSRWWTMRYPAGLGVLRSSSGQRGEPPTSRWSQPAGQSGILALQLECRRERRCGGPCKSAACERMGQMRRFYGSHSPEWRHERSRPVAEGRRCLRPR